MRRCGSACRSRRSRTRCTTRSASGRSPPSSASRTSTASCWKPIRHGRPIRTPCTCCACRAPAARRCRCRHRDDHANRRTTGGHAPGTVPLGHAELRPRARLFAEQRGPGDRGRRTGDRHAGDHLRQLFRRRRRVPEVAGRRTVADPGRDRGDLHRARRAVRKLDPPDHHPVHAALGRHRRAARADAVRHRPVAGRAGRHRAADGHREEERDHDGRFRHRGGARRATSRRRMRSARPACCGSGRS